MNDRFKFRVWNEEAKQYNLSEYFIMPDGDLIEEIGGEDVLDEGDVIEQCTGIKDENRKLIYEGDILGYFNNKMAVVWNNKDPSFELIGLAGTRYGKLSQEYVDSFGFEIIGNIHEKESK